MERSRDSILDGFQFQNSETYWEIRRLLERRPPSRFSDGLSREARMVIDQLKEESKSCNTPQTSDDHSHNNTDRRYSNLKPAKTKVKSDEPRKKKSVTYTDSLEKSALRLDRDITDPNFNEMKQRKRSLGGGPVQSAMETIEIVNASEPTEITEDDFAIEETAKHNSVEKCIVWMEVNDNQDDSESIIGAVAE
ncbi:unnamed protein product [Mytilus coruscus]|uniref:Uncharacterized protein n=1 Tax=Mytilus coruscus TaxID=42192 RepID=A0A6J8B997_MYTCO|nr:unnamed protein product [Mytilus coruscus]